MANRFPIIVDTDDGNKFKELPVGDNLDLSGSGIVNASSIEVNGNLDVQSLTVNEQTLATVAVTGSYTDLDNVPVGFSGSYNDLSNKPTIPSNTKTLTDVSVTDPTDGQILVFNATAGRYEPKDQTDIDLSASSINELQDVITTGTSELKYLKYQSGAWRPGNINYSEILNKPVNVSQFVNDSGYVGLSELAAGDPLLIGVDTTFDGINIFSRRNDFVGNFYIDNADSTGTVDIATSTTNIQSLDGFGLDSSAGDLTIRGQGLLISDPGNGASISDATELNLSGSISFSGSTLTNIPAISETLEASAFKGNLIGKNLNEDLLIDGTTFEANFSDLTLTGSFNIPLATDPTSAIGSPGDTAGELRVGITDTLSERYLYHCSADYDGVSSIWYRVAMTNNW